MTEDFSIRVQACTFPALRDDLARGTALCGDYRFRCLSIPAHVQAWVEMTGHRFITLSISPSGRNCAVRAGALELEFDAEVDVSREVEHDLQRPLTTIATGELVLEGGK